MFFFIIIRSMAVKNRVRFRWGNGCRVFQDLGGGV